MTCGTLRDFVTRLALKTKGQDLPTAVTDHASDLPLGRDLLFGLLDEILAANPKKIPRVNVKRIQKVQTLIAVNELN